MSKFSILVLTTLFGVIAGTLNGLSLYIGWPQDIVKFKTTIILHGAYHGGVLALTLAIALFSFSSNWIRRYTSRFHVSLLWIYVLGTIGGVVASLTFEASNNGKGIALFNFEYWRVWGLLFGGPVVLGVSFGILSYFVNRVSLLKGYAMTIVGGACGGMIFWYLGVAKGENLHVCITGLTHGALFGLCCAVGFLGFGSRGKILLERKGALDETRQI